MATLILITLEKENIEFSLNSYLIAPILVIIVDQGPYSQNFFTQIRKILVTLTWILELISHQK
jgi:hypothetical protein